MPNRPPHDRTNSLVLLGKVWAIGFSFGASVAAGGLIGWGIDFFAGSKPVGLLIGLGLGLTTGMVRFIREAKDAERAMEAERKSRSAGRAPDRPS